MEYRKNLDNKNIEDKKEEVAEITPQKQVVFVAVIVIVVVVVVVVVVKTQ